MGFTFEEARGETLTKFSFEEASGELGQPEPEPVLAPPILLSAEQQAISGLDNPFSPANSWMGERGSEPTLKEDLTGQLIDWSPPTAKADDSALGPPSAAFYNTFIKGGYDFLNTPVGAATLGAGALPKIAQKGLALFFGTEMAKAAAEKAGEASVTGDPTTAFEAGFTALPVPLLARHAAKGIGAATPTPKFQVAPREFKPAVEAVKPEVTASKAQTQAEVAAELGLTADAAGEGLWQFSVKTPEGKSVPFAVKESASKADITARAEMLKKEFAGEAVNPDIERVSKQTPDEFTAEMEKMKQSGRGLTKSAYDLGEKLKEADIPALEAAEKSAITENRRLLSESIKNPDKAQAAQQLNQAMAGGMKKQYFTEALKWRRALDESKSAKTIEDFAAIEEKHGVGDGLNKGQGLKAAFDRIQNEKAQTTQRKEVLDEGVETVALDPVTGSPLSATDSLINRLETPNQPGAVAKLGAAPSAQSAVSAPAPSPARPPITQPTVGGVPPVVPPVAPPGAVPAPAPGGGPTTLKDIYSIFEPAPKPKVSLGQRVSNVAEAVRTGVSSKFRPIQKLAEDISASYGSTKKNVAGIFEQLKGSSGKGEADIYRFDQDVSKLVRGSEKDFSAYLFLRRGLDRLNQDVADVAAGLPARRKVSTYTPADLQSKLQLLESQIGPEKLAKFQQAADKYQQHMDQALQLQVDSGRMSPAVYADIKSGNQFYAPFKVMKHIEETSQPAGSGKRIDTLADFTKAMEGIESPDFKLGDMLGAARQNILLSRILAEKNRAMQNVTQLAAIDVNSQFITKLRTGQDAPKGMEAVNVLEGGKETRYAVNPDVAQAVQLYGENGGGVISSLLSKMSIPFRAGATALNLPFQVSNLLADVPRQALVSRYGTKGVSDLIRYPLDFLDSAFSNILGEMVGYRNKLMLDFLDSGVAGATIQEHLTPKALRTETVSLPKKFASGVLYSIPNFAKAIEQTSKTVGVKRAMRFEGVQSGAQLAKQIPEAVTEIRRFSGSPDFGRQGKWVEQARLNLLYMFLNARIQGTIADVGRLTGRDGAGTAAKTWAKVLPAVGLPTLYAYLVNNSAENAEDYAKRPAQEKQNYWLIPKDNDNGSPRYITGANNEKIRDYWRIPKRESSKWIANMVESGMEFAEKRTPETFSKWAQGMMEDITPVNIQGDTAQERIESAAAGLNPLLKAPAELATGRDMYRHRDIIPDRQKKASPELQYTDRTAEVFKQAAAAMPDVAPEFMRSPLMLENMTKNLTAGLITQFLPRKPVEGRTETENNPMLQRFQAVPYTDSTEFDERMKALERESADEQITRFRTADKLVRSNKDKSVDVIVKQMIAEHGPDKRLLERVTDLWVAEKRGITGQERRVLALPVQQRASYIIDEISRTPPELKQETLRNLAMKRILTESVAQEMAKLKAQ